MYQGDPNATVTPSQVQNIISATPADENEVIHVGLPKGRIVVSNRWKESEIVTELRKHVSIIFTDAGSIDFYPSEKSGVVYLSEVDLSMGSCYRRNLAKLRNSKLRGYVLYEKSEITKEWYSSVQKYAVLDLGLAFFPVVSTTRAAQILIQLEKVESRPQSNPFLIEKRTLPFDLLVSETFNTIHGLGPARKKLLLEHFRSIAAVANASLEELTAVIGKAAALQVWNVFQ